jgi:molybdopterin-guanine dinucleotide biosynthesis protein A
MVNLHLFLDKDDGVFSPMVALASILENFKDSYVFCLSVDAPFVKEEQIQALWEVAQKTPNSAIIPRDSETKHPLCGLYHSSLAPMARGLAKENNHKLGFLLQKCGAIYVDFTDCTPFTNLNYPHEYESLILL